MKFYNFAIVSMITVIMSCSPSKKEYASYKDYPVRTDNLIEMTYTPSATTFSLWSPTAEDIRVMIYEEGDGGNPAKMVPLIYDKEGTWKGVIKEDLLGKFYAFSVKINGKWLGETPGINARAVGVNGKRGAIINMPATNPVGWDSDVKPPLASPADMIIYEMHHRDFSIHESSGIEHKGKYLALTEQYTVVPEDHHTTGISHLMELGVTHVHLLPSFDFASIDETKLEKNMYNWGYDPQNYNVPEGSYSSNPYDPYSRVREFKQMVQSLHRAGIRVILDVVYNHTFTLDNSPFERTVPGYFYRKNPDGTYADGSACGNETASERPMMRKYMIESVLYWINEYHIDGFRFDLMGIHDIGTMNEIRKAVDKIDPTICIYGEGWSAKAPRYPADSLAMKEKISKMPGIAAFSDEFRDGLRGPFNNNEQGSFLAGVAGGEESIKFGIVGAVEHPQIDYTKVNYANAPWATQPTQMISYVSCHDDMCLTDRLKSTIPEMKTEQLVRLSKLAQTMVFTSQGIPFIFAGEEIMRNKRGVHNSFESSDLINAIEWTNKIVYEDVFNYYKKLIQFRKNHPAFRMGNADLIRKHLEFLPVSDDNVVAFYIKDHANGDSWKEIVVAFNGNEKVVNLTIPKGADYKIVCSDGRFDEENGFGKVNFNEVLIPGRSALIIYR